MTIPDKEAVRALREIADYLDDGFPACSSHVQDRLDKVVQALRGASPVGRVIAQPGEAVTGPVPRNEACPVCGRARWEHTARQTELCAHTRALRETQSIFGKGDR
jgi:hypothetical protein